MSEREPGRTNFWGPPKEGAKELSFKEKVIGPVDQHSAVQNLFIGLFDKVFVAPVVFFRGILESTRAPEEPWYHRRYRRVPTIDECYFSDDACRQVNNK